MPGGIAGVGAGHEYTKIVRPTEDRGLDAGMGAQALKLRIQGRW